MSTHPEYVVMRKRYWPLFSTLVYRDGARCARCSSEYKLRIDHIISVREGGRTLLDNLQLLCHGCNTIKGSTTHDYRPADRGALGAQQPTYDEAGRVIVHYRYTPFRFLPVSFITRTGVDRIAVVNLWRPRAPYVQRFGLNEIRSADIPLIVPPEYADA